MSARPSHLPRPTAPIAETHPVSGVLVDPPSRHAQSPPLPTPAPVAPATTTKPFGDWEATAKRLILPWENLVLMSGSVVPMSNVPRLFRRGWFYGISTFAANGVPSANAANVSMGNNERYLPWLVTPYAGFYGVLLDAAVGGQGAPWHVYDLNKIFALGNNGDAIFYSIE